MRNFKKGISLVLTSIMILGSFTPILATVEETQTTSTSETLATDVYFNQDSSFTVTIPKLVTLDSSKTSAYEVTVTGDISSDEEIKVVPEETFKMKDQSSVNQKNDVEATVQQDKISWFFNEFETKGNGTITATDLTAGSWKGSFFFNINLQSNYISVNAKNEDGEDINASATNIIGTRKEQLLTLLEETGYIDSAQDVDALINVTSDDFEGLAETTFDVSNIASEGEQVVILHFNEETQEWEYIGTETVDSNGTVTGNFTSYSPVAFVKVKEDGNLEKIPEAGAYDANGNIITTWDNLKNLYGFNIEMDYPSNGNAYNDSSSMYNIIDKKLHNIKSLVIPNNISHIGNSAFTNCSTLTNITLPNSITSIGQYAFYQCLELTSIVIPNGVTNLDGEYIFADCRKLSSITLPNSITSIGKGVFIYCKNLNSIIFNGTIEEWNAIKKGTDWNSGVSSSAKVICTDGSIDLK